MIRNRLDLHIRLEKIEGLAIKKDGKPAVYFQPPSNIKMIFPCIIYTRSPTGIKYADNDSYILAEHYTITVVDSDPDTKIPGNLIKVLKTASPGRVYTYENLNHYTFSI